MSDLIGNDDSMIKVNTQPATLRTEREDEKISVSGFTTTTLICYCWRVGGSSRYAALYIGCIRDEVLKKRRGLEYI